MNRKKVVSVMLTLALAASVVSFSGCKASTTHTNGQEPQVSEQPQESTGEASQTTEGTDYNLTDNIKDGVILHAWSWSFNTIKESMADIAAAGYSTIQTSPANKCIEGGNGGMQLMGQGKWYYHYQPTDWTIGNYQFGTEDEFKAMCDEAEKYGIKIIVDVVPNHTTSTTDAVSENLINAVGGADKLYHKNGKKDITSYSNRLECTTGAMGGLPDVNTENPAFQDYFIKYLNQCIADGADGFRYDTAKHIALSDDPQEDSSLQNNFWEIVTTKIDKADTIFNYGEVLQGDNDRVADYIKAIGHTTASSYGADLRSSLSTGKLNAESLSNLKVGGSTDVVTWVESHDNYTDGSSLRLTDTKLIEGWAVIAASGNGTPLFFDRPFEADADKQWGTMNRIGAAGSTLYKHKSVTAINHFRNAMVGEDTKMTNPDAEKSVLMIARGSKGVVVINTGSTEYSLNADTALADGTYSDRANDGVEFTVSGGKITGTVPAEGVSVLYNDGYSAPVSMPSVSIETDSFTTSEDSISVVVHAKDSSKNTYTLDGGSETEFADGDSITVNLSDSTALKVSATNDNGLTSTMTYYFTKTSSNKSGSSISFKKPSGWGDKVYAYVYDETVNPVESNGDWPGEEMTKNSDGTYSYTLSKDWTSALVIFSDGANQYPAALEPGAELVAGKTYEADSSATENTKPQEESKESEPAAQPQETVVTFKKPDNWGSTVNAYVYENGGGGKNAEWPGEKMTDNGDGTYSYTVPSDVKSPTIIFNDGKNQYPASGQPGMAVENGKTYTAQ
ncbi:MAG: starch-binding protein [Acutalibacteraceae bacterium]